MSEDELYEQRPEASQSVLEWVGDRVPMGGSALDFVAMTTDAPDEVREFATAYRDWLERYERESMTWPICQDPNSSRVRYFGGEWLSGWAGADYRDGDVMASHSYLGTMRAMVKRGATEEDMRRMAARIYAHEAQLAALRREMADDLSRAMEGV